MLHRLRNKKMIILVMTVFTILFCMSGMCYADTGGDVAGAVEDTWTTARTQIVDVVDHVVFPVIDTVLAVMFFVKVGMCYFDYRKHGHFEFAGPCILFACLAFTLTAPLYIWNII